MLTDDDYRENDDYTENLLIFDDSWQLDYGDEEDDPNEWA